MRKVKVEPINFRTAYKHERRDFGQVKPYTQTFKSKRDYDRKRFKAETRELCHRA